MNLNHLGTMIELMPATHVLLESQRSFRRSSDVPPRPLQCQLVAISMANKHGSCTRKIPQKYYHLVMTNSSPWKITIFNR